MPPPCAAAGRDGEPLEPGCCPQHQIGRRGPFPELTGELDSEHLGDEHAHRLAEHGRLGLDTTDPQPRTPSPLTVGVCESVPTRVSGYACGPSGPCLVNTTRERYSRLTWWKMPVSGGTTRKSSKACCAQRSSW